MKRSIHLLLFSSIALVSVLSSAQGLSFFVDGTYAGDTRYNVKKLFDGNDDNLCWAAAASNALGLWQARNSAYLPEGVPNGQTQAVYSSDIFYTFTRSFLDRGGYEEDGFSWWINGVFQRDFSYPIRPDPLSVGGYYSAWGWEDFALEVAVNSGKDVLLEVLSDSIASNYLLTAGIYGGVYGGSAHAISMWGYQIDELTGELTGVWIGDSDSHDTGNVLVDVRWNDSLNRWDLGGDYEYWHLDDLTLFSAPMIPEPSYGVFVLSASALLFLAVRRRKRAAT